MPFDSHSDLAVLREQVEQLARENQELREMLVHGGAPVRASSESLQVRAAAHRVGLTPEELRRRRWKARVIGVLLLAGGIGVGISAARLVMWDVADGYREGRDDGRRGRVETPAVRPAGTRVIIVPAPPVPPVPPAPIAPRIAP